MAIQPFLAMTPEEIAENKVLPQKIAWMACHFSPRNSGLIQLPRSLPSGSLLVLDDSIPVSGHDPQRILDQLLRCRDATGYCALLLDFQRPGSQDAAALAQAIVSALPCPVAVSALYCHVCSCAVCLPPVPPSEAPEDYLRPWQDREVWLELALNGEEITVTESGSSIRSLPRLSPAAQEFFDDTLLCRYHCKILQDAVRFLLRRAPEDLDRFLTEVAKLGVARTVGLYQEWHWRSYSGKDPCT